MRKFSLLLLLSIAAAGLSSILVRSQILQRTPFTATVSHRMYGDGGTRVYRSDGILAVRSDGSVVQTRNQLTSDGKQWARTHFIDLAAKKEIRYDDLTRSTSTTRLSDRRADEMRAKPVSCNEEDSELTPGETILGYETVEVERIFQLGPRTVRRVSWKAPVLDCFPIRENVYFSHGGPFRLVNSLEVLAVTLGEPRDELFAVPDGYQERMPSEILTEYSRMYPDEYPMEKLDQIRPHIDRPYIRNQP